MRLRIAMIVVVLLTACGTAEARKYPCGLCPPVLTLREEILEARCAVLLQRVGMQPVASAEELYRSNGEPPTGTFRIVHVLNGSKEYVVGQTLELMETESSLAAEGQQKLYTWLGHEGRGWSGLLTLSPEAAGYIAEVSRRRMELSPEFYFQHWLSTDPLVAADVQDELEQLDRPQLCSLAKLADRRKLVEIVRGEITGQRRIALTLLGECGTPDDAEMLREIILLPEARSERHLGEVMESYLRLTGERGIVLLEDEFLKNYCASYTKIYAAIWALRQIQMDGTISAERLSKSLRPMLDRLDLADLVIVHYAQIQDWNVLDRVAALFKESTPGCHWARVPAARYMQMCPLSEARNYLDEFRTIDPKAVSRAEIFFPAPPGPNGE
jgi:hypothetical protein